MKRRSTLADLLRQGSEQATELPPDMPEPVASGALRAMGFSLERMSAEAETARDLKAKIEGGEYVVELDPKLVDASFVSDRIPVDHDAEFNAFLKSIEEQGQQVPILVRPDAQSEGRFQVAYGHRRLKAAAILGRAVKAIVRPLTDIELVIAQAKENLDRRDLSYIERALFAWRLEQRKFERGTIMAALGVDKGDMSRLLMVASGIPSEIIRAIGPAPKVGRPRWVQLSDMLKAAGAQKKACAVVTDPAFGRADTNMRFNLIIQALAAAPEKARSTPKSVLGVSGQVLARIEETSRRMVLSLDEPQFRAFVLSRLPALVEEFEQNAP
ncbi:plasmid partitioning protein RepB [Methylocapsa aurea]|uniref:plasmid partitioning protein RepB n=1 Tax=Methylocapsa aurea TaxID=663610 RepID=UPI0006921AB2|nr:plasmid partitioning protein RepB [Methylocapsa aurea]